MVSSSGEKFSARGEKCETRASAVRRVKHATIRAIAPSFQEARHRDLFRGAASTDVQTWIRGDG
jgi:hypothetical protein